VPDVVDLHGHLVLGTFYPGAKVLVGRAAQRDAEHQAAFLYLVADREHGQAGPAGVREPADTAGRNEPSVLGLLQPFHLRIPDRWFTPRLRSGRTVVFRAGRVVRGAACKAPVTGTGSGSAPGPARSPTGTRAAHRVSLPVFCARDAQGAPEVRHRGTAAG